MIAKITETYDSCFLLEEWVGNINNDELMILITKNLSNELIHFLTDKDSKLYWKVQPSIIHITDTGWQGTFLEPNLKESEQYSQAQKLIKLGYPKERLVLRVDPIIPTKDGIKHLYYTLNKYKFSGIKRCRISMMDLYPHVRNRLVGLQSNYELSDEVHKQIQNILDAYKYYNKIHFTARSAMFSYVDDIINKFKGFYKFEKCCEVMLNANSIGCVSQLDYDLNGVHNNQLSKGNQRVNCGCLQKQQLIPGGMSRGRCPHKCLYCYLKDHE